MRIFFLGLVLLFLTISSNVFCQLAIGQWRYHIAYNRVDDVAFLGSSVYAATPYGLLQYDLDDESVATIDKLDGLTGSVITAIATNEEGSEIIIGYEDGNLDIVDDNEVFGFSRLRNVPGITGSLRINHILVRSDIAYISTDYGVVLFDLNIREVKETWRDLGASGTLLQIFESDIEGDSIALATANGVLVGNLNDNLLDFAKWVRYNQGNFSSGIDAVEYGDAGLFAAISNVGLFEKNGGTFMMLPMLAGAKFNSLDYTGNKVLITTESEVHLLGNDGNFTTIASDLITAPLVAKEWNDVIWVGDAISGLLSGDGNGFASIRPSGPSVNGLLEIETLSSGLYAFGTGGLIQYYHNNQWMTFTAPTDSIVDVAEHSNRIFVATDGEGLLAYESIDKSPAVFDQSNSPLVSAGSGVRISALTSSTDGLWVVNYGAFKPLHLFNNGNWTSYTPEVSFAQSATELVVDPFADLWMVVRPADGGGAVYFSPSNQSSRWLTSTTDGGGLPVQSVRSMAVDRDGYVWVGTDEGVAYFFSNEADAVKPIFENRFLLKDDRITAIAIDGGNRKWIGTEKGAWLFNPTGEELVHHFTVENSPLLSDTILDIAIDQTTGEVFFSTTKGMISYGGDATSGRESVESVKIFPNPVTQAFDGLVGITGLATDAIVKITDVSGKLLWQTRANGGTATWNIRDYNGRRASTGVYLVFGATVDGREGVVGKIAVID